MADSSIESVESFTRRARAWIEENLRPASEPTGIVLDDEAHLAEVAEARRLQRLIFDGGFAGIRYPKEYGGQGLTREHQLAWRQLTAGREVPNFFKTSTGIMGPLLLDYGTDEQKNKHVPAILRGEELWVQFLSEPGAGSDLAALVTQAKRMDDTYVVNGSKIWTTGADIAQYALALVRTNVEAPKHKGLSMLIMPIQSPGITLRPIQVATGRADFCEEFFDDVEVPTSSLVGEENDGWAVVMRLFFHERNMVSDNGFNDITVLGVGERLVSPEDDIIALARYVGKSQDSATRELIAETIILNRLSDYTIKRVNAQMKAGLLPPPSVSILKLMRSYSQYRFKEIALLVGGAHAAMNGSDDEIGIHGHRWLVARIGTIAGGTTEMQRNAVSERVLGMPREPATDTDVPFREVLARQRQ